MGWGGTAWHGASPPPATSHPCSLSFWDLRPGGEQQNQEYTEGSSLLEPWGAAHSPNISG